MSLKKTYKINGKDEEKKRIYIYFPAPRRDWRLGVYARDNLDLQDIICSKQWPDICYLIDDKYSTNLYGQQGQFYARNLLVSSYKGGVISMAELLPAPGEIFNKQNSAKWKIKRNKLVFPYLKVMATIPYIIEAINEEASKILSIGLGGASIDNFFSEPPNKHNITVIEIDAAMKEVAQKWFGLKENGRHQVLVDDGVEFLRKLAENEKFDIIFIDACHSKREDNVKCPIPEFRTQEMAENIFKHLTENGVVIINVFILGEGVQEHFKQVLACTNKEIPKITTIEYQKRFDKMPLALQKVLKEQIDLVNYS